MNLDRAHVEWALGRYPAEELPELAAQMMVQGHDGPAILELASFHRLTRWDVPPGLVDRAFLESGRPSLTKGEVESAREERTRVDAEHLIGECLQERLSVQDLGREVWRLAGAVDDRWGPEFRALLLGHILLEDAWDASSRREAEVELLNAAGRFLKARRASTWTDGGRGSTAGCGRGSSACWGFGR